MKQALPMLSFPGGTVRLFRWLRAKKILQVDNTPYRRFIENKMFTYKSIQVPGKTSTQNVVQPMVTLKGLAYLQKLANKDFPACPPCDEKANQVNANTDIQNMKPAIDE